MKHDPKACWYAVYGAYISYQIAKCMDEGRGFPILDDEWEVIRGEAATVANCEAEYNSGRDIEIGTEFERFVQIRKPLCHKIRKGRKRYPVANVSSNR